MIKTVSIKNQSIDTSGIPKDYKDALSEYIWNGFELRATTVDLSYTVNSMGSLDTIIIEDNGSGIDMSTIDDTFGAFLTSQKSSLALHEKSKENKGKGRFSFVCFSSIAQWHTTYKKDNSLYSYLITMNGNTKEEYEITYTENIAQNTGTKVVFNNIIKISFFDVSYDNLKDYLLKTFSWYLFLRRNDKTKLFIDSNSLNYYEYINEKFTKNVSIDVDGYTFEANIIVWNEKITEKYCEYYFDNYFNYKGNNTTTFNRNMVEFNHSIYIKSEFFHDWVANNNSNQPSLIGKDATSDTYRTMKIKLQQEVMQIFTSYLIAKSDEAIKSMEERKSFPEFPDTPFGLFQRNDFISVVKELYKVEPRIFHKLKDVQEKSLLGFLNLLINSEERENLLTIIDGIVKLTPEQRNDFANTLKKTHLKNIIDCIKMIENRYYVIEVLKKVIYDLTDFTNERDHIQKTIESNYWLFGEQYNLVSADKPMQTALERLNYWLYSSTGNSTLSEDEENKRRMDIFLSASNKQIVSNGDGIVNNLIIELKAPNVVLTTKVYRQIEDYMNYIMRQPQFNGQHRQWKFIAVCASVDEEIKVKYRTFKDRNKHCLVNEADNWEIYAMTWDDVFCAFEMRNSYLLEKLKINRDLTITEIQNKIESPSRQSVDSIIKEIFI